MDYPTFAADPVIVAAGFVNVADYPQELVEQVISEVACFLPASRWAKGCTDCDRRELAVKYLTAHRLTVLTQAGVVVSANTSGLIPGQISSISASQGSQSLSFAQSPEGTKGAGWLSEGQTPTYWWSLFLGMLQARLVAIGFTS
ncbi:DUF4054 domain-containing protein [Leptolyngbyaceae cyanobacterium CCMR0082]|uniref:DUF4054 domain-containing protein n=1 Tax=Adonisia turfae CCMR0082 TaxID=2304604 RepID=A0A6M0S0N3_9CYAN|nr:DUF4054 domain-containing protein [Adonisia turfae]NEZ62014.1 DUF4054 domain-containing protein [Adonisia turfae CCMR0082]